MVIAITVEMSLIWCTVCCQEGGLADPRLIATVAYIMFDTRRAQTCLLPSHRKSGQQ